jgi:hypothetical protein
VCGLRCTTPASELTPPPKCSMDCPGEEQRHGMTSPAAGSTAARAAGQRGVPTGLPRVAGLGGREDGQGGVARGGGAATGLEPSSRRARWCEGGRRAQGCARASGFSSRNAGLGTRRGVVAVSRRSPARRHGRRRARRPRFAGVHVTGARRGSVRQGRPWRPRNRCPSPWQSCARLARPRQGRGDVSALEGDGEGKTQANRIEGAASSPEGVRVCWGAPGRKGFGPAQSRARARTRPWCGVPVRSGTVRHATVTRSK